LEFEDFKIKITRIEFEASIGNLLLRARDILLSAVQGSGIVIQDIEEVVLVGGASRVPAVRRMLREATFIQRVLRS